jgi:hypothetical protein
MAPPQQDRARLVIISQKLIWITLSIDYVTVEGDPTRKNLTSQRAQSSLNAMYSSKKCFWWGRPDLNRRPFPGAVFWTLSLRVSLTAPEPLHPF